MWAGNKLQSEKSENTKMPLMHNNNNNNNNNSNYDKGGDMDRLQMCTWNKDWSKVL